jgi:undecaprenyl-diphosphatase
MGISTSEVTDRPAFPGGPGGLPCTVDDVSPPNQLVVYILTVISRPAVVLTGAAAVVTYAVLWIGLIGNWAWLSTIDDWALTGFYALSADRPGFVIFWQAVSDALGPTALRILALAGIVVALIRRKVRVAVFLTVTVMMMGPLTVAAKALGDRPRPDTALAVEASTSFPSGHALAIAVSVPAFTTVLLPLLAPRARVAVIALGVALVLLVGLARVGLNVHHPSDVIAGWSLGLLYYVVCMALLPPRPGRGVTSAPSSGI